MADELRSWVEATGPFGAVTFVLLYAALTVLLVPGSLFSVAAGALFGAVVGTILTLLAAVLGAAVAYEIARAAGRERVRARLGPRLLGADRWIGRRGIRGVIGLRLLPVVPFNALNYAFGLSSVRRRDHALGTAIGIVPGTVAFVALGSSITDPTSPAFLGSLGAVLLLVLLSAVQLRRSPPPPPTPEVPAR